MIQQRNDGCEPICPKCGKLCGHTPEEMQYFALEAAEEATLMLLRMESFNFADQYLPPIVDGDPEHQAFTTQEELLAIPWIDRWSKKENFRRFVICKIDPYSNAYMAQYALGAELLSPQPRSPWLLAFVKHNMGLTIEEIPKWQA